MHYYAWVIFKKSKEGKMEEKKNKFICRIIHFYNHFIPAKTEQAVWKYAAFGVVDGIDVSEKFCGTTIEKILKQIWIEQNDFSKELMGEYCVQTIYGICCLDEQEEKNEEEFWKDDDAMPFYFFSRIQLKKKRSLQRETYGKLRDFLANKNNSESRIYFTFDNSDFLIVTKASTYTEGVQLIDDVHQNYELISEGGEQKDKLKNSFTLFAIRRDIVEKIEEEEWYNRFNSFEKLDLVSIRIMEKECNRSQFCIERLNTQLVKKGYNVKKIQPILGIDDGIIVLLDVLWGEFLTLYSHEAAFFREQNIAGITTTIYGRTCVDMLGTCDEKCGKDDEKLNEIILYEGYVAYLRKKLRSLMKQKNTDQYKELFVILNVLPKFSGEGFSDYLFFSLLQPIDMLMDLIKANARLDSYYEFIKIFNIYVQNSTKSDRNSMQSMDFNAQIYDIPCKLMAFYTALIYMARDILNGNNESQKYEFVVTPSVTNIVYVKELFQKVSDEKRLISVEVPESHFYDVSNVMVIFMHEAAHYVGRDIQNRKDRYEYLLKSIASVYINYIRSYWEEERTKDIEGKEIRWTDLIERAFLVLKAMLHRECNRDFLKNYQIGEGNNSDEQIAKNCINNEKYYAYNSFLQQNLYRALMDITERALPNVFQSLTFQLELEEADIYEYIQSISEKFLVRYTEKTTRMTADTVLEQLTGIYEECFADIMSISILKMNGKDYLDSIISGIEQQGMTVETGCLSSGIYRVMLICDIMRKEEGNGWLESIYEKDNLQKREQIMHYIKKMGVIIKTGWHGNMRPEEYRTNCFYALLDSDIYKDARKYLILCRKTFLDNVVKCNKSRLCEKLSELYGMEKGRGNEDRIEYQLEMMEEIIFLYRNNVYREIKNKLEAGKKDEQ